MTKAEREELRERKVNIWAHEVGLHADQPSIGFLTITTVERDALLDAAEECERLERECTSLRGEVAYLKAQNRMLEQRRAAGEGET
jgi:hypothetical protein